ncbi:MAG TPA: type II toxin-antitoxin system VapC family toxin [Candidatus Angelobacter sp.]
MSGFLLDTNVVSELIRPKPDQHVRNWIDSADENLLHLSVLTLGEVRKGIALLSSAARRISLEAWLSNDLVLRFAGRILPIDQEIAERWGWITAKAMVAGISLPVIDGLLASTALHFNLTLVTRNTKDVAATGVSAFNPWPAQSP